MGEPFAISLNLPCSPSDLAESIAQADAAKEALDLANKRIAICLLQEALELHPWIDLVRVSNGLPIAVGKASAMDKAKASASFKSIGERIQSEPIAWSKQETHPSEAAQWLAHAILDDDELSQWQEDVAIAKVGDPHVPPADQAQPNLKVPKATKTSLADAIRHRL